MNRFFLPFLLSLNLVLPLSAQTRAGRVQARLRETPDAKWWQIMDTGPFLSDTFRIFGGNGDVGVLKGIAIKLGENEGHTVVFDTETMRMVAGFEGTVSPGGTSRNGKERRVEGERMRQRATE